jgi:serine/threonine-protein kinase
VSEDYVPEHDTYLNTVIGGRYVVDELIGEGGMGRVYRCHHRVIGKRVAVKILHAELARDKEAVGRFVREARAASSIGNAHIIDISDFGETEDGSTYFVMEYLDGTPLSDMIEDRGVLPAELVCDIALQLCDGLAGAHSKDIVHRDLKPDNVTLVTQGDRKNFCKILDFGIAKVSTGQSATTKLTMAGAVFGTPHYMSPEQAAGTTVDHRTDIYSLGVMMYEMVSGEMPFNADNFMGILTQHMYKAPVPIRALVNAPDCPPGFEALILKCLSKKPDARYQTMDELAADIRKFLADGMPVAVAEMMARSGGHHIPADYFQTSGPAIVPATPEPRRERSSGPRVAAFVGALAAVAIVAVVLVLYYNTTSAKPPPSPTPVAAPQPAETPSPAPPEPSAPTPAPSPSATADGVKVLLHSVPAKATAVVDGQQVSLPKHFVVPPGETVDVEVRAPGYKSQMVTLDGRSEMVEVELEKVGRPATNGSGTGRPPQPRPKTPQPKGGSGEVVDPWG